MFWQGSSSSSSFVIHNEISINAFNTQKLSIPNSTTHSIFYFIEKIQILHNRAQWKHIVKNRKIIIIPK